jgi:hypothetical protein
LVDVDDNIVGIVSWGATSCDPLEFPGVFARVSAKWDWINQQVCDNAIVIPAWAECGGGGGGGKTNRCNDLTRLEWVQCALLNNIGG